MQNFIDEFRQRGFLNQATDEENLRKKSNIAAYIGFDCTANSLHVGSLVQIMTLRMLQKHGHRPIILIGGGTTKIGDPSGRDETRQILTEEIIQENMAGIKSVLSKFVNFDDSVNGAIMVNNDDWLSKLNYIDFLREFGKLFSVNRMLSFDSVRLRLERQQNLSFLEFNYILLQSYDFIELARTHNCILQIGGSDQWGNIVSGIELSRKIGGPELFGLTTPLITKSDGSKMGKTASGAVWLSEELLSPYEYFQFWRNVADADVERFLKLFTELPISEIEEICKFKDERINEAKKILAFEATKICHGPEKAKQALEESVKIFEENQMSSLPITEISLHEAINLVDLLMKLEFCSSKGEAKRLIAGGGAKIDDVSIKDEEFVINSQNFSNASVKISSGKKKHVFVKFV